MGVEGEEDRHMEISLGSQILGDNVKENGVAAKREEVFGEKNNADGSKVDSRNGVGMEYETVESGNMEVKEKGECSSNGGLGSCLSGEENGFPCDLKEFEKRALRELRAKVEEAILSGKLFENGSKNKVEESKNDESQENSKTAADKGKAKVEEKEEEFKESGENVETNENITLWGVPLLASKDDASTDVLLFKFLSAREYSVNDAYEMLKKTLEWRKENRIDSINNEDCGSDHDSLCYMKGHDYKGHPVCYNVYGVFANDELYNKTFGTEANRDKFLRWRLKLMENQIKMLDFRAGGVSSMLQINDLKNAPRPSRRDLRLATKRVVQILQDNYPEFVVRNIFINVPFWYYAFNAILSPFLTQRTKAKFVFTRPSRVTETLLKYIAAGEIPIQYGGLHRENDPEFSTQDAASEAIVKAGGIETIEIPAPQVGKVLMWDLTVIGWDVSYKEEFVPTDEKSYTVIVQKTRNISWQQEPIRNTFKNSEPGKVAITVENGIFRKKRVLYRYKMKDPFDSS